VFDSSLAMAEAALQGLGVALAPPLMLARVLDDGSLVRPFPQEVVTGRYWLTWLKSRTPGTAMTAFSDWIVAASGR
jgi:LysR family transcriptional regulator of beta-lactamase